MPHEYLHVKRDKLCKYNQDMNLLLWHLSWFEINRKLPERWALLLVEDKRVRKLAREHAGRRLE